jgi:lipid A oxidase
MIFSIGFGERIVRKSISRGRGSDVGTSRRRALAFAAAALAGSALVWAAMGWLAAHGGLEDALQSFNLAHGLSAAVVLFALGSCGVLLAGAGLELLLSAEALHKAVLGLAVLAPLNFAAKPESNKATATTEPSAAISAAQPEIQLGIYGGGNYTPDADVFLKQPNGTDMVLKNVPWTGEPFDDPPYYGLRGTYWTPAVPKFGAMIDFTHAKAISQRKQEVDQSGTRDGETVPPREQVDATFTKLEYSHGLNFLTLNAVYRMSGWHKRFVPYVGAGAGLVIPHTEIARKDIGRQNWTYRYEITGPGFQALAGIEWRVFPSDKYSVFTEYKAGYAINSTELLEGGTVTNQLWAHQAIFGLSAIVHRPALASAAR